MYLLIYSLLSISFANGQTINFDDPIFKSILVSTTTSTYIALDELNQPVAIDSNGNGEIEVEESAQVFKLSLPSNANISSLTGIEFFTNLTKLICNYNELTELDVSMLTNLYFLHVISNQLENLQFNPQLELLNCHSNNLGNLDFSESIVLTNLTCRNNNLTELDLSNAHNLRSLNCKDNQLTSLIIASLPLTTAICDNNLLTELDLTQVGDDSDVDALTISCANNLLSNIDVTVTVNSKVFLDCSDNLSLESLNVKNGELFHDSNAHEPPSAAVRLNNNISLEIICADEFNFGYLQAKLNEEGILDCELTSECALGITEIEKVHFALYPNPIKEVLIVKCPAQYDTLMLYNNIGQIIYKTSFEPDMPIKLDFLSSGNYIVKLISENDIQQFKIIKK